jgi:hypothetical protein
MAVVATAHAELEIEGSQKGDPFVASKLAPPDRNVPSRLVWVCAAIPLPVTLAETRSLLMRASIDRLACARTDR